MRFSHILVATCLVFFATQALGADWGERLSREDALAQLDSEDSRERREGLARLAEVGMSEDVPFMLQRLHDHEPLVRGMAEQALWGLWLRSSDRTVNRLFQTSIQMIRQRELDQAIETLDEIISYEPGFAEAWNKRGDAYSRRLGQRGHVGDYRTVVDDRPAPCHGRAELREARRVEGHEHVGSGRGGREDLRARDVDIRI